jgi:hypothetical protein
MFTLNMLTASIINLAMQAVSTSEISACFYETTQCNTYEKDVIFILAAVRT